MHQIKGRASHAEALFSFYEKKKPALAVVYTTQIQTSSDGVAKCQEDAKGMFFLMIH